MRKDATKRARHGLTSLCGAPAVCRALALSVTCLFSIPALSEPPQKGVVAKTARYESIVAEAAERFAISASWIQAVIDIESHGDPRALSPKGAIGLMQLMPKTYEELRSRYALGADPYDPRDSIMAGAAYLREMYDRFGVSGFLAAYNAGPERYQDHLTRDRPLPLETQAYVAQLALRLSGTLPDGDTLDIGQHGGWRSASLFTARVPSTRDNAAKTNPVTSGSRDSDTLTPKAHALTPPRGQLFIPLSGRKTSAMASAVTAPAVRCSTPAATASMTRHSQNAATTIAIISGLSSRRRMRAR